MAELLITFTTHVHTYVCRMYICMYVFYLREKMCQSIVSQIFERTVQLQRLTMVFVCRNLTLQYLHMFVCRRFTVELN